MAETQASPDPRPDPDPKPNEKLVKVFDSEWWAGWLEESFAGLGGMLILVREEDAERARQLRADYRRSPDDDETAEIDIIEERPPKA
jgi:hypothetical protein